MAYPAPYSVPAAPAVQDPRSIQELSSPLFEARGWLKFLGVLSIINGILTALSVVGIIVAWLPIWMGVLMYQAGSSIDSAGQFGDRFAFLNSLGSLKTYFVLQGVLTLIGLLLAFTMICVVFILPLFGLAVIPWQQIINNVPYSY